VFFKQSVDWARQSLPCFIYVTCPLVLCVLFSAHSFTVGPISTDALTYLRGRFQPDALSSLYLPDSHSVPTPDKVRDQLRQKHCCVLSRILRGIATCQQRFLGPPANVSIVIVDWFND
jgi:hypothetical protein